MSDGLPLVTTREVKPAAVIHELLWFISGSVDINKLKFKFFWQRWAVTQADVDAWMDKYFNGIPKDCEYYQKELAKAQEKIGTIGKMYGHAWRKAPMNVESIAWMPKRELEDFPTPILDKIAEDFTADGRKPFEDGCSILEQLYMQPDSESTKWLREVVTPLAAQEYWKHYDQLNELILNLKTNPFSSRHRVMASIPEWTAFEHMSPQENTLAGRGCLTPCHTFFQCFVKPAETEGGKMKLSLKLYMSSNDMPVGRVYNIAQYSVLLCMIAQCVDMEADEFIISTGDGHIYSNQHEGVAEQVKREPLPLPKLWLNPAIKHLFDFTPDDIKILDYQCEPKIDYEVSV